jgi:hypothetical protein
VAEAHFGETASFVPTLALLIEHVVVFWRVALADFHLGELAVFVMAAPVGINAG